MSARRIAADIAEAGGVEPVKLEHTSDPEISFCSEEQERQLRGQLKKLEEVVGCGLKVIVFPN